MKYLRNISLGAGLMAAMLSVDVASAQVSVPSVTTANPGYLFPNDQYQRQREQARKKNRNARDQRALSRCTEDLVPRAEYRRMETQYRQKVVAEGKQSADRWSQQQASVWHRRLQRQGVCR